MATGPDLLSRFREAFEEFSQLEILLDRRGSSPNDLDISAWSTGCCAPSA
jgi:hypothetical protein